MTTFERPKNTIDNAFDLSVGDHVWHVFGIWPPQMGGEHIVTQLARPFEQNREYSDIHSGSADEIVFDTQWIDSKYSTMNFAADGNLVPGRSHNNNYWFRSEADALAAVELLRAEWEASGTIAEEIERQEEDRRFYDHWVDA